MAEILLVQKRERLSKLLGMFLGNGGKGEMRSFITPETFTAFMQKLKLEHYQEKKKPKNQKNTNPTQTTFKLVVCQATGGFFKKGEDSSFLVWRREESMTSGKLKYLR